MESSSNVIPTVMQQPSKHENLARLAKNLLSQHTAELL
jgi:hypothetical protein